MIKTINLENEFRIFNRTFKLMVKDLVRLNEFQAGYSEEKKNTNIRINDRVRKEDFESRLKDLETRIFQKVYIDYSFITLYSWMISSYQWIIPYRTFRGRQGGKFVHLKITK